jgi:hypothetical protein
MLAEAQPEYLLEFGCSGYRAEKVTFRAVQRCMVRDYRSSTVVVLRGGQNVAKTQEARGPMALLLRSTGTQ